MKYLILPLFVLACTSANTQVSGNASYSKQKLIGQSQFDDLQFTEINLNIPSASSNKIAFNIKGMANVKADNYVAIFSLTQVGKTMKQTDSLLNERMKVVSKNIQKLDSTELYVDMVRFVPLYDVLHEKKLFSKDTYNEVPNGFEMKKNLHIHYKNQTQLSSIISICAEAEIYNLIRVDYFSKQLDDIKLRLLDEARKKLDKRLNHYKIIMGNDLDGLNKSISDGFKIIYPIERYQKCVAYNNNSFKLKSSSRNYKAEKNQAQYYQPIVNKEFDFVLNPVIVEPVIQVMYEMKVLLTQQLPNKQEKEYILVSPTGDLKTLNID